MPSPLSPETPQLRCVECMRLFPAGEVMHLGDAPVCAECKPTAVAKLAGGRALGRFWRSGQLLVMLLSEDVAVFPARCVRCNESLGVSWVDGHIVRSAQGCVMVVVILPLLMLVPVLMPLWLPKVWPNSPFTVPRVPGFLFFIPLLLLVPILLKTRRTPWRYALCEPHRREAQRWLSWERVLSIVFGIGLTAAMFLWKGSTGPWPAVVVALVSAIFSKNSRAVRLKRRNGAHYFFSGCGPEFLAQFPDWPEPR